MGNYYHKQNLSVRLERWTRAHHILLAALIMFIIGLLVVIGYVAMQLRDPEVSQQSQEYREDFVGHAGQTINTDDFSFETIASWELAPSESTLPSKYVYYSKHGGLVDHRVTIYVDTVPADLIATYVVPVTVGEDSHIIPSVVSRRCGDGLPRSTKQPIRITYESVTFLCNQESAEMIIAAGLKGGSYGIPLGQRKVGFVFDNLKASLDIDSFTQILDSFSFK
jgi:hypothetical protein